MILEEIRTIVNGYIILLVIAIGLFTFLVDAKELKGKELKKDATITRMIGISYIILGPVLFIILRIVKS